MSATASLTEGVLSPLDRTRTAFFVRALRVQALRPWLVVKRRRVPALLLAHALVAAVLATLWPTLLLIVGPLLLGVPHVVADVRYLVVRPALAPRLRVTLLAGCGVLLLVRVLELAGLAARVELACAAVWIAAVGVAAARRPGTRSLIVAGAAALAMFAAMLWPNPTRLVLAHAHNLVAIGIWALAFCGSWRRGLAVGAIILTIAVVLLVSPLAWWGFRHGVPSGFGLHAFAAADTLAPHVANVPLALGLVASFAFLQSVHYALWLHAIPQEATRGEGTLSFRMTYRGLLDDFGKPALALVALATALVLVAGCVAPLRTQATYLSLSAFHGYLELAVASLWFVTRKRAL